jgi:glycosyltransferase involved in cell wall biosynthesis
MRLLVSDYSGHPFQVQLSRHLAAKGHDVTHVYFSEFQTPRGDLEERADDPTLFRLRPVSIGRPFAKTRFLKRRMQELQVGAEIAKVIKDVNPEVVLSANAPLDTQRRILRATKTQGARFFFWLQDIYSVAITSVLEQKFGPLGRFVGHRYRSLEVAMMNRSDGIIAVSADFLGFLREHRVCTPATVIENWAPFDRLSERARNPSPGERKPFRFVYSGTLGYKHDPELLLLLAERTGAEVHIHTEGPTAEFLRNEATRRGLSDTVRVSGWVPFDELALVLDRADVLVAMIGTEAGTYSVPSKVFSYLCTGKPLLLSVPAENLAARVVARENAGLVAAPERRDEFLANALRLQANPDLRASLGRNGLAYAERAFDIDRIAERFKLIMTNQPKKTSGYIPALNTRVRAFASNVSDSSVLSLTRKAKSWVG